MTTFDDPIFDPWGTSDEIPRPARWRTSRMRHGVPAPRPAPSAIRVEEPAPRLDPLSAPASARVPTRVPGTDRTEPQPSGSGAGGGILSELVTPRLRVLAARLELARHGTTLDERVGQSPPAVRFRIKLRAGPFDALDELGSVIEFVGPDGGDSHLVARLWLDPVQPNASHECVLPVASLDTTRVDRVLLDFLSRVLQRTSP